MKSYLQRRKLATIERDLSAEPTLAALTKLFPEPPSGLSSWAPVRPHPRSEPESRQRRIRLVTWLATVVGILGTADVVIGGVLRAATITSAGMAMAVAGIAILAVDLLCSKEPVKQAPHRFSRP